MNRNIFILIIVLCCAAMHSGAQVTVDQIRYILNTEDNTASVTYSMTFSPQKGGVNYQRLRNITIPEAITVDEVQYAVTGIGDHAFNNSDIRTISLPNTIRSIGEQAFNKATGLTMIEIPEGVESIGYEAFYDCKTLRRIQLPSTLETIAGGAFGLSNGSISRYVYATNLSAWLNIDFADEESNPVTGELYFNGSTLNEIEIPDDISAIKPYAFHNVKCRSVVVPNHVTEIAGHAFDACKAANITVGDGVEEIYYSTFANSSSLRSVVLGKNVTKISGTNFYNISGMIGVTCYSQEPPAMVDGSFFLDIDMAGHDTYVSEEEDDEGNTTDDYYTLDNVTLYVPKGTKEAYATAPTWERFTHIVELEKTTTAIEKIGCSTTGNDTWHTLSGLRLSSKPTTPGLYFHAGQKTLLK